MIISDVTYQTKAAGKLGPILPTFQVIIVKLREREGQRVDPGRSLKGHL